MTQSRRDLLEAANADMIAKLKRMNEKVAQELGARMQRCRDDRIRRRESPVVTVVQAVRAGFQYKCKTVACWCCRTGHIKRKKNQAAKLFTSAANGTCSLATVNAADPCPDLRKVAAAHRKFADDIDNLRDALSRVDKRFAGMSAFAVLEVNHDGSQWRPHWHVIVSHPQIDRQEIASVFRKKFPGSRRVQLTMFDPTKSVIENCENIVGYAFKFSHVDWSTDQSSEFFLWIRQRAALRSMCVSLQARLSPCSLVLDSVSSKPNWLRFDNLPSRASNALEHDFTLECGLSITGTGHEASVPITAPPQVDVVASWHAIAAGLLDRARALEATYQLQRRSQAASVFPPMPS